MKIFIVIAVGAVPSALLAALGFEYHGAIAYGTGLFIGRITQRMELRWLQ